ncbi:TadZ/CpaE-like protein [Micavibrio aeruginosavorus EPB]|uniref:TadZ/CpaE-like protein n=2 Tax=Micavibrio aeruginosavorus TaxID=349221 RepID=M4VD62_9BACT|nr:TadZ/CpaE-like protein [Micavibrio aeruginosavorus EPB]
MKNMETQYRGRRFLSFWRDTRGSTAVEFGLVAIPFIFMTIGIIELALVFAAANMLEGGVAEASRLIRTGELQQAGGDPEETFREALCAHALVLIECDGIVVESIAIEDNTFEGISELVPEYDEDGNLIPSGFELGEVSDVVLVRVAYRYQFMTPLFGDIFSNQPDRAYPMLATAVMRTEPYEFEDE